jgi:hypothetical protein
VIEGMRAVVPDVSVNVEYAACDRWYKKAKPDFSPDGNALQLWQPALPMKEKTIAIAS